MTKGSVRLNRKRNYKVEDILDDKVIFEACSMKMLTFPGNAASAKYIKGKTVIVWT